MTTTQPRPTARQTAPTTIGLRAAMERRTRRAALVGGLALLVLAILAAVAHFGAIESLITEGDGTTTAADIRAAEGQFRLGIAAMVVVAALDVVVAWALLSFFAPVNHGIATLAAWMRLGYAVIFAVAISQLAGALHVLSADQRGTEVLLKIQAYHDIWDISLVLFGVHLVLIGYLSYKSGYVPRILGVLLVIAGAGYLVDSFAGLLVASYSISVADFTFVGEALLIVWLLAKGRNITLQQ